MLAHDGGELADGVADADVLERHALVVEHHLVHVGGELDLVDVGVARPVHQHVEHRLFGHARQPAEQVDDLRAPLRREPPHHAEVDDHDAVARHVEHVAGMRVGVEEAVEQDHLEERVDAARREKFFV